jgi:hypothetical protein
MLTSCHRDGGLSDAQVSQSWHRYVSSHAGTARNDGADVTLAVTLAKTPPDATCLAGPVALWRRRRDHAAPRIVPRPCGTVTLSDVVDGIAVMSSRTYLIR